MTRVLNLAHEARRLLIALEAERLDYALCGAFALAVHGAVRATTDIDLLVDETGVMPVRAVAMSLGFAEHAEPMRFDDGMVLHRSSKRAGTQAITLDLLAVSVPYRPVWDRRIRVPLGETEISVVSRDGLVNMKLWAARPRDVLDVQLLRELDR